ncbi:MAG: glycosyltransferase [Desulfurivibrionaceae bacterium]
MLNFLFWLAAASLLGNIYVSGTVVRGVRRMTHIRDVPRLKGGGIPRVSVVIPACNEEKTITPALESVLNLDYPGLEVIVVNDRSTDYTGKVLEGIKKRYPELRVFTVTELPRGWLGKCHALQYGAERARGEYILFTDADVIMERSTLSRAMHHVLANRLDHLCMFFSNMASGGLLNTLLMEIAGGLLLFFKPWKAGDPESRHFMGVGAFNLVKSSAYRAIGGHRSIALQPIDDIMLGRAIKESGYAQDCLLGTGFVRVAWYSRVGDLVRGLMKNIFAACDYRTGRVLAGIALILFLNVLPFWGALLSTGSVSLLFLIAVLVRLGSFAGGLPASGLSPWYAPWALVTPYIQIYIIIRATVITLRNKGITWRGTYYPLADLKDKNRR